MLFRSVGIDSLQKAVHNLIREERIKLKCIGLVYTMVTSSAKQEKLKTNFENKKAVNDIDIFSAKMSVVNNIQYGAAGPIPTKYQVSKEDIEAISLELLERLAGDEV